MRWKFSSVVRDGTFVGSALIAGFLSASKNPRDLKLFPKLVVLGCHAFFSRPASKAVRIHPRLTTGKRQTCTLISAIQLPASFLYWTRPCSDFQISENVRQDRILAMYSGWPKISPPHFISWKTSDSLPFIGTGCSVIEASGNNVVCLKLL